jgi:hypothetical protein
VHLRVLVGLQPVVVVWHCILLYILQPIALAGRSRTEDMHGLILPMAAGGFPGASTADPGGPWSWRERCNIALKLAAIFGGGAPAGPPPWGWLGLKDIIRRDVLDG